MFDAIDVRLYNEDIPRSSHQRKVVSVACRTNHPAG